MIYYLILLFGLFMALIGFSIGLLVGAKNKSVELQDIDTLEHRIQKIVFDLEMGSMSHEEATDELIKCFDEYKAKHRNNKKAN